MRRKTVRALVNLGRFAALAGCGLACLTWSVWRRGWATSLPPERHFAVPIPPALNDMPPGARRDAQLATAVLAHFGPVRGLDRRARAVADWRELLAEALRELGDAARLEQVLDEAVAADAFDLVAQAMRHELRSQRADRTADALEQLRGLVRQAPTPEVTAPFVRALLQHGRCQEAFDVLAAVVERPLANDWRVQARSVTGSGSPVGVADTGQAGGLRLVVAAGPDASLLRVTLPPFASAAFVDLRVRIWATGEAQRAAVREEAAGPDALLGLQQSGDLLVATGLCDAAFTLQLAAPGPGPYVVEARVQPRLPTVLARLTLLPTFAAWGRGLADDGPAGARARWRGWRQTALAGLAIDLDTVGATQRVALRPAAGGVEAVFALDTTTPELAAELGFDLPQGRVCLPLHTLELVTGGATHTIDLTTHADLVLRDLERTPDGFVVTGDRPRLRVRHGVPGALQHATLRGVP